MSAQGGATRQTIVFLIVGGASFFLYYGLFEVLRRSITDGRALTIAYAVALSFNFTANRAITFRQSSGGGVGTLLSIGRFGVLALINYFVSVGLTLTALSAGVPSLLAVSLGIMATTFVSFLLSKYWVFRSHPIR